MFGPFTPWGFLAQGGFGFGPWGFGGPFTVEGGAPGGFYTPAGFGATIGRPIPPPYSAGAFLGPGGMGAGFGIF
jgi:hypothetical protein